MNLTPEQQAIVDHNLPPRNALKCIAYAGTGKTSTLIAVAREYEDECLYLAFSKSVENEAVMKFPVNTTCKTGHALAWSHIGRKYANISNLYNWQLAKSYRLSLYESSLLLKSLESYLSSADPTPLLAHVEPDILNKFVPGLYESEMVEKVERLWIDMQDSRMSIPMTHSGYLKMFALAVERGDIALDYPTVLLDEAQDTNPVMLGLMLTLMRQGARAYFVGDPYQQIYSWRGALDAMDKIEAPNYRITQSFRFGDRIADVGSMVLRTFFDEKSPLRGLSSVEDNVMLAQAGEKTIVCRTNAGLIRAAYGCVLDNYPIHIIGEKAFTDVLESLNNIYFLYANKKHLMTDNRLRFHNTYADLIQFSEESLDVELQGKIAIIEKVRSEWPTMREKIQNGLTDMTSAQVILTTCHKAKGLEWPVVELNDDFRPMLYSMFDNETGEVKTKLKTVTRKVKDDETEIHPEEINLIYVALTRAKKTLIPSMSLSNLIRHVKNLDSKSNGNLIPL